jgi:hypothetical protein
MIRYYTRMARYALAALAHVAFGTGVSGPRN